MNTTYAKVKDDHTLEYAPSVLDGFHNPSEARCRAHGYKPAVYAAAPGDAPVGKHYEQDGWMDAGDTVSPRWVLVDNAPRTRRFVTADVIEQLMIEGVWPQARQWLEQKGMLDMVLATKEFTSDDRNYIAARTALQAELGWTDSQVVRLLAKAEMGGAA